MTREDKELLLKDLCARLPYGVKVQHQHPYYLDEIQTIEHISRQYGEIETESVLGFVDDFKPYLFPLSSMTEEQEENWERTLALDYQLSYDTIDWLLKNHFDYRGLISKGLAIDCTNLNIY